MPDNIQLYQDDAAGIAAIIQALDDLEGKTDLSVIVNVSSDGEPIGYIWRLTDKYVFSNRSSE